VFSIGIYTGASPLTLAEPADHIRNPVITRDMITDHYTTLVADPFMVRDGGTWNMFFETVNWNGWSSKGEIALATSRDGVCWAFQGVVLAEPFHLSYPYVFAHGSDHYMLPESSQVGAVRLYRAERFPTRWRFVKDLRIGPVLLDSSVFRHDERWWMLSEADEDRGELRLFHASDLMGPWVEHPKSPVFRGNGAARPAGRVISASGRLIRFAQDCRVAYGTSVSAIEITRLDPHDYAEAPLLGGRPLLSGSGERWNQMGMHHVDAHELEDGSWIACVDGWRDRFRRPRALAAWAAGHVRRVVGR
jgi:hypothetical protein